MDGVGRIISWNEAAVVVTQRPEEEMLGMRGQEAFPAIAQAIDDFLETGDTGVEKGEFAMRVGDGRDADEATIYYHLTAIEREGDAWTPHLILSLWDVSELNTLKTRLDEAEKLGAMSRIAGAVAHEIRNPLNSIFLNSDLLEREVGKTEGMSGDKVKRYVERVREEVERLNDIIADYLSLARLSDLRRKTGDLRSVIADFVSELRTRWRGAKIKVVGDFDAPLPPVSFDDRQIRRVLLNLATNARDAMPSGGQVTFAASVRNGVIEVSVKDTGPGMDHSALKRATEPFFTRKEGGTGLGLYLVQEIVRAHGGELRLDSRPGEGVRATFGLPVAEVDETGEAADDEDLVSHEV
jgi:two-component system sensor histidine kinase HydH